MGCTWRTARWLLWWLWLACADVAAESAAATTLDCDELEFLTCEGRNCCCISSGVDEFFCNVKDISVTVDARTGAYYSVKCLDKSLSYEQLPRLVSNQTLTKVEFKQGCGLPRSSFGHILSTLGIVSIPKLVLDGVLNRKNNTLPPHLMLGLGALSTLSLAQNGLRTLPNGFFEPLINLTWLDLKRNIIQLDEGSLAGLPRLRTLELDENGLKQLPQGVFASLPELRVLRLGHNELTELPSDALTANVHILELDLSANPLRNIPTEILANATQLEELTISGAWFSSLPVGVFTNTRALRRLVLWDNAEWVDVPARLLAGLHALELVWVRRAAIRQLPADLLAGTGALRKLYLTGTRLEALPARLLCDTYNLEILDLSNNLLSMIPSDAFTSLGALRELILKDNAIRTINADAFNGLVTVEKIDLSGNGLLELSTAALDHTPRLLRFDLEHNELRTPWELPKTLHQLRLHHNKLQEIPDAWRRNAPVLVNLDFAHNHITQMQYSDFSFVRINESTVDLRHNDLSTVLLDENNYRDDQNTSDSASARVHLLLGDNPFTCNCSLYWFLRAVRDRGGRIGTSFISLENAVCSEPKAMRGLALETLDLASLRCEVPASECPMGCACAVRAHNPALVVECENVTRLPGHLKELGLPVVLRLNHANVSRLRRGDLWSSLIELDLEGGSLMDVEEGALPPDLRLLSLRHNQLMTLGAAAAEHLLANGRRVWLAGNPLRCDCAGAPLLAAIQEHFTQVEDYAALRCPGNKSVSLVTTGALCRPDTAVAAGSGLAVLGLLIGLAAALFYKYKREAKVWLYARGVCLGWLLDEELDCDKRYDAFVSFSHLDEPFVVGELVPPLEAGPNPLRLCVHFRDWVPGEPIPAQIATSVRASRRTIVVLSQNYLRSAWGRVEFRVATAEAERVRAPRLIVILLGDVGPIDAIDPELRAYLATNTYIKWGDPWFWDKLRYALPHRRRRPRADSVSDADRSVLRRSHFDDRLEVEDSEKPIANGKSFCAPTAEPAPASA